MSFCSVFTIRLSTSTIRLLPPSTLRCPLSAYRLQATIVRLPPTTIRFPSAFYRQPPSFNHPPCTSRLPASSAPTFTIRLPQHPPSYIHHPLPSFRNHHCCHATSAVHLSALTPRLPLFASQLSPSTFYSLPPAPTIPTISCPSCTLLATELPAARVPREAMPSGACATCSFPQSRALVSRGRSCCRRPQIETRPPDCDPSDLWKHSRRKDIQQNQEG